MSEDEAEDLIDDIEAVRVKNNRLWIRLLRIAHRANPEATKEILRQINENDQKISQLIGKIADA